jgi:succinyl-CoA synthetase beta subunit
VVKAQIHAGGRGKAGGVKVVKSLADLKTAATDILGKTLVTPQTGAEGRLVRRLYVEEGCAIARELYLSFLVDRGTQRVMVIASTEGGMDIEEVAEHTPDKNFYLYGGSRHRLASFSRSPAVPCLWPDRKGQRAKRHEAVCQSVQRLLGD